MASLNLIQIKRSNVTDVPPHDALAPGELAYSFAPTSNSLFVGDNSNNAVRVGGGKYQWLHQSNTTTPGAATANAVVITNGNGFVTAIKTNGLTIGGDGTTSQITSVSSTSNAAQLGLGSNTDVATSWAVQNYVNGAISAVQNQSTNTQVIHNANGVLVGSNGFIYDYTNLTLQIGGTDTGMLRVGNTTGTYTNIGPTAAVFGGTITATGNATLSNTLTVTGASRFDGQTTVANNLIVSGVTNTAALNVSGVANLANSVVIGGLATDTVQVKAVVQSNVVPQADGTYQLGNNTFRWAHVYSNNATLTGSLSAGGNATVTGTANVGALNVNGDATVSGNLYVQGVMTVIQSNTVNISDPLIRVANNNATTDVVDIGVYGSYGNTTTTRYTGLFRDASDGIYRLFDSLEPEPTTVVDTTNATFHLASLMLTTLHANTVNASSLSSANVSITGGSISGITDLAVGDGGTGVSSFTTNGVVYGNGTSALQVTAAGANGHVLQVVSGVPQFGSIDGGTF
jgi:hypothetical protein